MEQLRPFFAPLERALEVGGTRKDIIFLAVSTIALVISFFAPDALPFNAAWIAIVLCGLPIICEAIIGLACEFDIKADVLVSIALIASVIIGEYFAAGEVAVIMQLGGLLEELTVARARTGIEKLVEMTPRTARIIDLNSEREVPAEEVQLGQMVRVLPGETIPVDGVIETGTTSIDESVVTGESMPKDAGPGDEVASGTVNQFGAIDVRATRAGSDGTIQRMAALVQSADAGKAKIVRMADRWATWVVIIALAAAVGVYLVTGEILRSVTVLVVFCPCALVLATPTAIMAAIGNATKHGFLVKEGDALERLAKVKRVAFDKTGTLTHGKPRVAEVTVVGGAEAIEEAPKELLRLTASAELRSEHPLGRAIVRSAREDGLNLTEPTNFQMVPGQGVVASCDGKRIAAGNLKLMEAQGVEPRDWTDANAEGLLAQGCTLTYVAIDGQAAGIVALTDTLRNEAPQTVAAIRSAGAEPVLLTGDNQAAANAIASAVGINQLQAECKPEDKMTYIEHTEAEGAPVAMVGDGINDAPALHRAYVGIAMGGVGSDIAIEAADIAIVEDRISELPHLLTLSRKTMRKIKANLTFSMTLNFVAIALALTAVLDPVSGALVHNAGSVFVIANSSLLLNWKMKQ